MLSIGVMPIPPATRTIGRGESSIRMKMTGWRPYREPRALLDLVVEISSRRVRAGHLGLGRRQDPLDGHPVVVGIRPVRQGVAAHHRPGLMAHRVRNLQSEGEVLARLEGGERLAIGGYQVERADRPGVVFDDAALDQEIPESIPGGFRGGKFLRCASGLRFARRRSKRPVFPSLAENPYAHQNGNLRHNRGKDDKR